MKKVAIIGSSEFQIPLIVAAKKQGFETHVFSWGGNEALADHFYKISIIEKQAILEKCKNIGVDGVCSIGSDLANITVNYVASNLGLITNSFDCVENTTNKHKMRMHLVKHNLPSPKFHYLGEKSTFKPDFYPLIVKPVDRSGSRGINFVDSSVNIQSAVDSAFSESFSKEVLMEEYIDGREFSVESISFDGMHEILQITEKFTTGKPGFIERGHTCPARVSNTEKSLIEDLVLQVLKAFDVSNGASHTELKINSKGEIFIIEIGSRMGGDYIGSDLVYYSTGFDYTRAVLSIAMGEYREHDYYLSETEKQNFSAVKFVFNQDDYKSCVSASTVNDVDVIHSELKNNVFESKVRITSSAGRLGHILLTADLAIQDEVLNMLGF
ncbi:ATP-grasp domain-containing protein [Shewanella algae]|uniref:ATP-grasp domain-containing protein n=1 Tax=Shewanella algae TaxID=38313 RepID=UPI003AAA7354